jgi:hypothetical protein
MSDDVCYTMSRSHFNIEDYKDCILQLKDNVKDVLEPDHDDGYLLRWLKGKDITEGLGVITCVNTTGF